MKERLKSKDKTKMVYAVFSVFVLLLLVTTSFSGAITRNITSISDNMKTFVCNSNGKYWNPTNANIQLAIWDFNDTNGGEVYVPVGNYSGSLNITNNVEVIGTGTIAVQSNGAGVLSGENDNITQLYLDVGETIIVWNGNIRNLKICTSSAWAGQYALHVTGDETQWGRQNFLDNIHVTNYNADDDGDIFDGTGIYLEAEASASRKSNIALCNFGAFYVDGFNIGVEIYSADANPTKQGYINGNDFEYIGISRCKYMLNMTNNGNGTNNNNNFKSLQMQPDNNENTTNGGLYCNDSGNIFQYIMPWDWSYADEGYAIHMGDDSEQNHVTGYFMSDDYVKNYDGNVINNIFSANLSGMNKIYTTDITTTKIINKGEGLRIGNIENNLNTIIYIDSAETGVSDLIFTDNQSSTKSYKMRLNIPGNKLQFNAAANDVDTDIFGSGDKINPTLKVNAGVRRVEITNLTVKDLFILEGRTVDPTPLSEGMIWYNTTANMFYCRADSTTYTFNLTAV